MKCTKFCMVIIFVWFYLEKKYELGYHHLKPGFTRPVMIHRAILGSLERMIAVLTE